MLIRLPLTRDRLLALLPAACLSALLFAPATACGQGYSLGPELTQPLAAPSNAPPGATAGLPSSAGVVAADAPRQIVADVQVIGNNATKDHEVFKHIQTRQDREFDSEQLQGDARRLLQTGLFRDVKTYTRATPGGVVVTFEVFERPRINYLKHLGNRHGPSRKETEDRARPRGGRPAHFVLDRRGPPQDRRAVSHERLSKRHRLDSRRQQEGRPGSCLRHQRGAARTDFAGRDRRQHNRQRSPPGNTDRVEARLSVVFLPGQARPREDRRRRGKADRLLPQPGLLPGPRGPRAGIRRLGQVGHAPLHDRRGAAVRRPQRDGRRERKIRQPAAAGVSASSNRENTSTRPR